MTKNGRIPVVALAIKDVDYIAKAIHEVTSWKALLSAMVILTSEYIVSHVIADVKMYPCLTAFCKLWSNTV